MEKNSLELKAQSLGRFIADEIRRRIWNKEIEFGERLLEPELSTEFGVSRGSLREALQILKHEGLVVVKPRKGTFVATFTEKDLHAIYEARVLIEVFAFVNAIPHIKERELQHLDSILKSMHEQIHLEKWNELLNLDLEFHSYIVNLCQNDRIIKFYNTIQIQILTLLTRLSDYVDRRTFYNDHYELLEVIKTRNPILIEQKVREHIQDNEKLFGIG